MSQEEQEQPQPQEQAPEPPKPEDQPAQPAAAAAGSEQPAAVAAEAKGPERREGDRPARPERPERGRDGPDSRRRPSFRRRKVCTFCVEGATHIDYKDPMKFRRFISDRARIEPRRKTGTCAKHQRWLSTALKRARHLALLPYTPDHIRLTGVFASRK